MEEKQTSVFFLLSLIKENFIQVESVKLVYFLYLQLFQWTFCLIISSFLPLQTDSSSPTMTFIQSFMQQTIYMGMPDDSVRNSVVLFQLLGQQACFFPFFLFLWYVWVENFYQAELRVRKRERGVYSRGQWGRRMNEWEAKRWKEGRKKEWGRAER